MVVHVHVYFGTDSAHENTNSHDLNCANDDSMMNGKHHIQQTSLIRHKEHKTFTYIIIRGRQSITIKQHGNMCPKDSYGADHEPVLLNLVTSLFIFMFIICCLTHSHAIPMNIAFQFPISQLIIYLLHIFPSIMSCIIIQSPR